MDTVSMLNTMSFYCQPILPLVYDESMSYYETLCKVVGQLNNTGETVNKLNEGLTSEIADRKAGDAALDERLKQIEALNGRIHFLVFDGANPSGTMPTRSELYNWVRNGDAIYTLFSTNESGRGRVYAASCSYNAGNWGSEASNDFNIIVPLETKYDSANDYAVKQKVAKLTIPPISKPSLSVPWGLQIIEINTPYTSAEGVVNVIAVVSDSGSVNCSITPSEFLQLYNMTRGGKNLCVAVNAKLLYDGLARSSSIATVDTTNRIVRIAFERDYGTAITNGVNQLNKTLNYIIGDAKTGTWVHETIDSKIFDFIRYEGFQFTRGAHDVITTDDESTPNAVYAQYHSDTSGKLYQNLPTRLIDSVDGAEYWNGTFDIYGGNHMTFTFVTSNYATASDKMLVRVIELSADVGTTAWKYGVKEFTLPLSGGETTTYVDFWGTGQDEVYDNGLKAWTITLATNQTFDAIFDLISSGANVVARLYKDSTKSELIAKSVETQLSGDKTIGNIIFSFVHASPDVFLGFPTIADAIWLTKTSTATSVYALYKWCALPVPAGDGSDNGKVPTVKGTAWELKDQNSKPLYITIDVANIDERIYTLTDGNKTYTVEEIYAAKENGTPVFIAPADIGTYFQVLDFSFSNTAFKAFFLNVIRRSDMSYGRLTISTVGGQTKGVYIAGGFLAASSSANNGKFLKMKQNGSGIEYVDDNAVLYTEQTLTNPQKLQARKNIDALGSLAPNIQHYMVITPPNEGAGIGVSLSATGTGGHFTLDISDANEGQPTKLTGVKTPTDAETNAAATVEYVKNSVAKKLNQTEPVIKDGVTLESGSYQIYAQPIGQTSATGEDFASLNFSDNSPQGTGAGIVISGLANFGDAEAVGLEDTAVSYAQLVAYSTPLTLTYDNNQVTGASYADIRKAITRGRQIKMVVANMTDIIATNAKNETDRSILSFIDTSVGGDTVDFTRYSVTAQASGITVNVKSMQLP